MRKYLLSTSTLAALIAAGSAQAQSVSDAAPAQSAASDVGTVGGDIIVTAGRRNEALSRVAISVVAETQEALQTKGVRDVVDLARSTPSLQLRQGGQGSNYVAIRGITSTVGASTTGIYIDDTPIQARAIGAGNGTSTAFPTLFDLNRVEVLRGPQGTLFGAGSEGGTVRFIQAEPGLTKFTGYSRAEIAATEHGDPSAELGAALGGPIIKDVLGFRVSGYVRRDGGWVDRQPISGAAGGKDENDRETVSLRAALTFAPTEGLTITPALLYQDVDGYGSPDSWDILSNYSKGRYVSGNETRDVSSDRFFLPSLKIAYDLGPVTITSNTGYLSRTSMLDTDYTSFLSSLFQGGRAVTVASVPGFQSLSSFRQHQKAFTQELRVQNSNADSRFNWVVGVFYQHARQDVAQSTNGTLPNEASIATSGKTILQRYGQDMLPGSVFVATTDESLDKQIAAFGQADFKVTPWLKLTAGLRYAKTNFEFENAGNGPFNGGPTSTSGKQSEKPVTPKFGISVEPSGDTLLYATAAKGFRPGGANATVSTTVCGTELAAIGLTSAPTSFNSDSVWSYEVGAKQKLIGNKLRVAASAFYIDWSNIQQRISLACGFAYNSNLGSAVSKGADLQIEFSPISGLDLSASAAYTHAAYSETVLGGVTNASTGARSTIVSKGDRLPTAPWTITLGAAYSFLLGDYDMYLRADYNYASSFQNLPNTPAVSYDPALYRNDNANYVNMRAGTKINSLDLSFFVNNLLNSTDIIRRTHVNVRAPMLREMTVRPRTFGVTASYNF